MITGLEKALRIAIEAHAGQKDKAGEPYILHPIRLMLQQTTNDTRIVALLHDVLEDSVVTAEDLAKTGFSKQVFRAVQCLTRNADEDYFIYISKIKKNKMARTVKLADLEDNMKLARLKRINEKDKKRLQRYRRAYRFLKSE